MTSALFSFSHYKDFLREQCSVNGKIRGYQGKMAQAAGCPRSYLSRILNSKAHLSPEQAMKLSVFWALSEPETEYFLELVNLARTSLPLLTRRIRKRLQGIKQQAENFSKRFSEVETLNHEMEFHYYSAWYFAAIHVLIGMGGFQTIESVSQRLGIAPAITADTLSKLAAMGLARVEGKNWKRTPGHLHLSKDRPMISAHHGNWRNQAVQDSRDQNSDGMHYTLVQSHSFEDFDRIKQVLLSSIDKAREIMRPSENEEMTCLSLDFFRV